MDFSSGVSYNKVRVEVNSGKIEGGLKGYIYIIPDTQICFRFWGPLGYEIGKGYISQTKLSFYNEMEGVLITDLKAQIENLSGSVVSLKVFESLLTGQIDQFIYSLNQLNGNLLEIKADKGSGKSVLTIVHKINHSEMVVYFLYKKGQLKSTLLKLKKDKKITEVSFDFIDISYDRKKCTFAF